jgi:ABC-type Zn uptake system ZnuABC Zn-binding protein ZnuA
MGILIQLAKANRPSVVLAEEQIDAAVAASLAREAGVPVVRINPLGYPDSATAVSIGAYDRYLTRFTKEVVKGLTGK